MEHRRILIIDGHPDPSEQRYMHALVYAYQSAATLARHQVRVLRLAELDCPLLRSNDAFLHQPGPQSVRDAQSQIKWCDHLAIFYPLWLGSMPALLKAFFEQVMRPGFAFSQGKDTKQPKKLLTGKSARIVVTMGMPALFYRWYFRAHSLKNLERNILGFTGIAPIRATLIGSVATQDADKRTQWLERMRELGRGSR